MYLDNKCAFLKLSERNIDWYCERCTNNIFPFNELTDLH